jgi:hypothetical protein
MMWKTVCTALYWCPVAESPQGLANLFMTACWCCDGCSSYVEQQCGVILCKTVSIRVSWHEAPKEGSNSP